MYDEKREAAFRARKTREFMERHKDADEIVCDRQTKEPVEARYFNKTSLAWHREETRAFFRHLCESRYEKKMGGA